MKVLFVNYGRESLAIEYLSSMLKTAGHQVFLAHDPGVFSAQDNVIQDPFLAQVFSKRKQVLGKIKDVAPDVTCFSVYTNNYRYMVDLARDVKSVIKTTIVFGGPHATAVPEVVMANDFIDMTVVGEGEHAILDIVTSLKEGEGKRDIKNTWIRHNGEVIKNPLRPACDLGQLPFPDKDLFKGVIDHSRSYLLLASRGCPNNCFYCGEQVRNDLYQHQFFRRRSVESVMQELIFMKSKFDFKEVSFWDAIFTTDKKWLGALLPRYRQEINVPFRCFSEVRFFDEDTARILKDGGCYAIEFGLQNINSTLRGAVLGRTETDGQIKKSFDICDQFRIRYDIDHIFGLPGEKEQDFVQASYFYGTLKYLNRIKCHSLAYFPKSGIIDIARKSKILNESDVNNINHGFTGSFFDINSSQKGASRELRRDFWNLYKVLPLLPLPVLRFILRRKLYKAFRYIPGFFIIFLQMLDMLRKNDLRLKVYLRWSR